MIPKEKLKKDIQEIFLAGVKAVDPKKVIKDNIKIKGGKLFIYSKSYDLTDIKNIYVVGAGKAGASMSSALEEILLENITSGVVVVKYDHLMPTQLIKLVEAAHPIPDKAGMEGTELIVQLLMQAKKDDLVICLISGGGSALIPLPGNGISLKDKQIVNNVLLSCGATIHEINTIRKHISRIKGGKMARMAYPAKLITLILSDVIGDNLDIIASGPTVPDQSSFFDCLNIIEKYSLHEKFPTNVLDYINKGINGEIEENPKKNEPCFRNTDNFIIANNFLAIKAAEEKAGSMGYNTCILSSFFEGETKDVAGFHIKVAKEIKNSGNPLNTPACVISGGETTVTITGKGTGGRNQEFVLAVIEEISEIEGAVILSAGTDGTDGPTSAAGAIADWTTLGIAREKELNPKDYLKKNDSYHFFEKINGLITTGPTFTNVMDLHILLVG
ncbi:MAG: glycerate kinase [Thermodesulfobacteriota bacterium]|nr:glycerate kinase [Thermodesulfobacteriota bacterium]